MYKTFPENIKFLDLGKEVLAYWKDNVLKKVFLPKPIARNIPFMEFPPTTNELLGIHHVISRVVRKFEVKKEI